MAKQVAQRSMWTGSITFGLVNIPVKLYAAVREENVHFHLLHDQDHARLRRKLVCSVDGKEVHAEHIVKGYEIAPDQYVVIREEELEAVAPKRTRVIEIEDFVSLKEIDPVYFDRTYYVAPQETGTKAYQLLVEAMEKSGKAGIARFVMHSKEYLAALRARQGALCLETMHFSDEVLPLAKVGDVPAKTKPAEREVKMAEQLIESLAGKFKPDKYRDDYRDAVKEMVEKKAQGEQVVTAPAPKEQPGRVGNLMDALQASLAQVKSSGRPAKPEHPGETRKRRKRE